uniref:ATP-dependent RNA helicase n=1 Tax=Esox lucius TaxID=8010 RepID=A0A6Q2XZD0_ESOLU
MNCMGGKKPTDTTDPVKNFERWKKKYDKTKTRVKQEKRQKRKPEWLVEKESIQRLVNKYNEINAQDAVKFSDFPISKNTLRGLMEAQYRQPTEIQRQTIGFALQGKDVLGAAKTGSGKTLAFLIPVLECLYRQQWTAMDGLGALIISPTRELAYQTFEMLRKVGKNHEFSAGLIIGGKDLKNESEKIHRTNIIICTPGRLLHHMDGTAAFHISDLQMLVLDEADRILDMGFADTINAIVENLPKTRQTLLFSATQTKSVKDLARLSLKDPEYVWVHEKAKFSTPATLEQNYVVCELHQKVNLLFSFIRSHLQKKVIVFFASCKEVQYLFRVFCRLRPGVPILALHGKQQQMKRVEVYNDFIKRKNAVLFATDIAARGLDFPAVNWVLQFDCPEDANTYIHRVGRTARYKEGGEALLVLLPSEEQGMLSQLQEKKVPIDRIQVNPDKLTSVQQKLEAFLAQETEQKERAQRCFVSYLRSVYLMKNKDVFDVFRLRLQEYAEMSKKKPEKETKYKEAKKVLKRHFQVNTKVVFTEEGQVVQQWPPLQRTAVPQPEEDHTPGINVEEARERLRREDQEFDKLEYRRKVKEKHRVRPRHNFTKSAEEVEPYIEVDSGEEFDPSTLPDPDKLHNDSEEDNQSSSSCSDEEEEEAVGSRKRPRRQAASLPLDTGLSLAEDEELVMHLLGNRS